MSSIVLIVQSLMVVGLFAFVFISDWITINWSAFTRRVRNNMLQIIAEIIIVLVLVGCVMYLMLF